MLGLKLFLIANVCLILAHGILRPHAKPALPLFYLCLLALALYLNFGQVSRIFGTESAGFTKPSTLFSNYMRAKYYKELGENGLNNAVFSTSANLPLQVRSMEDPLKEVSSSEARAFQPEFSTRRAEEFEQDVKAFAENFGQESIPVFSGRPGSENETSMEFTATPAHQAVAYLVATLLPFSGGWYFGGHDLASNLNPASLLPLLDMALLVLACFFLWQAFGSTGLYACLIFFFTGTITGIFWTAGGFLQLMWLASLLIGLGFLQKRHFLWGGIWLGISAVLNVFPLVFLVGAGLSLLAHYQQRKETSLFPFLWLMAGGVAAIALLGFLSMELFGKSAWADYGNRVLTHLPAYDIEDLGYRKLKAMPEMVESDLWQADIATSNDSYFSWNDRLRSIDKQLGFIVLFGGYVMIAGAIWGLRRIPLAEGMLLFGSSVLYGMALLPLSNYGFLALLPVVLFKEWQSRWRRLTMLFLFGAFWGLSIYLAAEITPPMLSLYYVNLLLGAYLFIWMMISIIPKPDYRPNTGMYNALYHPQPVEQHPLMQNPYDARGR